MWACQRLHPAHMQELFNDPPRTNIYVGDQSDREGWARFRRQMAEKGVSFDVILDDGAALSADGHPPLRGV